MLLKERYPVVFVHVAGLMMANTLHLAFLMALCLYGQRYVYMTYLFFLFCVLTNCVKFDMIFGVEALHV